MTIKIETGIPIPAVNLASREGNPPLQEIWQALDLLAPGESFFIPYESDDFDGHLEARIRAAILLVGKQYFMMRKYPFLPPYNPPGIRVWRVAHE